MKLTIEILDVHGNVIEKSSDEYPGVVFVSSVSHSAENSIKITGYRPGKEGEK